LDFGLISLRPYYAQLLAKNGIKAILEENWADQHKVDFDTYIMLGLPDDFITSKIASRRSNWRFKPTPHPPQPAARGSSPRRADHECEYQGQEKCRRE